ncbi:hypothetical protein B0T14DRAFT_518268 [Immersiella caudata]|uniref:Uncharacterized protein n=1 Tax=Immersiella caudata TaxID=314043 RepID=A0AA39WNZ2_9PEZI|nr:hypothetical protein B0T14DRAFT_518268 [Immersiella caudata]
MIGRGAGSGAGADLGCLDGVGAAGVRRVVVVDWIGTVREAEVLACTRVDEGVTVERTLVTGSGGMPRAALSSADLRTARLIWAVAVAGRRFGAGEEDTAGVLTVAGASFLAGVVGVAVDLETALVLSADATLGVEETFLVELLDGLAEEETFFVASAVLVDVVCLVSLTVLATFSIALAALSAAGLVLDDEETFVVGEADGLALELLLAFGFDEEAGLGERLAVVDEKG